jgi:hypothetical protein
MVEIIIVNPIGSFKVDVDKTFFVEAHFYLKNSLMTYKRDAGLNSSFQGLTCRSVREMEGLCKALMFEEG